MSTSGRRCTICQAPAFATGNSRTFGRYREYRCENGHTFWSWSVPTPPVLRRKGGAGS
jgi:hypothetical protein